MRYDNYYRRRNTGRYLDSCSSSSDDSIVYKSKTKKIQSGINAKLSSSVQEQLHYPHFSLGQVSGFIGLNIQFHQLTFEQFIAGELETIHTCENTVEREGRIDLLHRITQWFLRANVSWPQIRNTYAHILQKVENREISWNADWDRFERHIYDRVINASTKTERARANTTKGTKPEFAWFCKEYQKLEGCPKDAPHPGRIGNQVRQLHHICAACWIKEKQKRTHPECSNECPHKDA